jgi:PLP dependent protein
LRSVESNLAVIRDKITQSCKKVGRDPRDIKIIAVTKYSTIERTKEAMEAGITHLGENRDQEFLNKYEALGNEPTWHFIGTLQSRKVKNIIDKVDYIHSLDRLSLAKEINKRANKTINCFVQVNVSGEESKHGLSPEDAIPFIQSLQQYSNIRVIGLMTMAPHTKDEMILRSCFKKLRQLQQDIQLLSLNNAPCRELSMGMSNDYEIAIEEGATYIRIGTALVGE